MTTNARLVEQKSKWAKENHDKKLESARRYRTDNREKLRLSARIWYHNNIQKARDHSRKTREKMREKLFDIIGRRCVVCGFLDIRALQFDHINGNGRKENIRLKRSPYLYLKYYVDHPDIARDTLQVLCANCNLIKCHMRAEAFTK